MRKYTLIAIIFFLCLHAEAQDAFRAVQQRTTRGVILDGDTIPYIQLQTSYIFSEPVFKNKREQKHHNQLVKKIKKVYPLAKRAGQLLRQYETQVDSLDTDSDRKRFYKQMEEQLKVEYEGEIRKMTTSEGRLLIKLIDRETGDSSYELLQELRSNFTAFFWQGIAKVFGQDLRDNYDPDGEDKHIEIIVLQINYGLL